jgi:hypothetical protein
MTNRKSGPSIMLFLMPLIIGLAGLSRVMNSAHFAAYRTVDVVQLLGSGVCFGASMVGIIMLLRQSRTDTLKGD